MSIRLLCGEPYTRPNCEQVHCSYLLDHPGVNHSWYAARVQDEADAEKIDYTPRAVQAFLDSIVRGEMDPYLEAVLAVAHNRKRALRDVPGFRPRNRPVTVTPPVQHPR